VRWPPGTGRINALAPGPLKVFRMLGGLRSVGLNRSTRATESAHAEPVFQPILSVGPSGYPSELSRVSAGRLDRVVDGRRLTKKLACDGAREGGNREVSAQASLRSRWVSIFLITAGSSMPVVIRKAPPQAGQPSDRCRRRVSATAPKSLLPGAKLAFSSRHFRR
jgi:hypothetical protein